MFNFTVSKRPINLSNNYQLFFAWWKSAIIFFCTLFPICTNKSFSLFSIYYVEIRNGIDFCHSLIGFYNHSGPPTIWILLMFLHYNHKKALFNNPSMWYQFSDSVIDRISNSFKSKMSPVFSSLDPIQSISWIQSEKIRIFFNWRLCITLCVRVAPILQEST